MKLEFLIPGLLALVAVLQGCGKGGGVSATVAQAVVEQPNCLAGQDHLWSELYRQVDRNGGLPAASDVETEIHSLAKNAAQADALVAAYSSIAREIRSLGRNEAMARLAEMEIGDRTSDEKVARQDEVEKNLTRALRTSIEALGTCPANSVPPASVGITDSVPLFEGWKTSVAPALYGAYKTISVGYQSCNAVALTPLSASIAAVSGITVTGTHPSGTGLTREVTDSAAVFRTNPFYAGRNSPPGGCFTASTIPLIYDYGGKPYASTAAGGEMDLFKNSGTGTDALGIDCSGFITTSVLAGGLRLKQNVSSKAAQTSGVNAAMFSNPAGNGLSCFARVPSTKTQSLISGDIIANSGHVIMVDRTSADPFGVASAKTTGDCDHVSSSNFDFTIIQSSASKGGIGMNRYRAADFLAGYTAMRTGLEAYAKSFCRVRLGVDSEETLANPSEAVVVRHTGAAGCMDAALPLTGQNCLQACGTASASTLASVTAGEKSLPN